ncbi:ATP-binding protein [Streptomyces europaeiscabiei]|uniref:ATP-binding protein n=1 Tax=Streptomyces europaeiscabiei TaxID=146819 RepID=UPI00399BC8F8
MEHSVSRVVVVSVALTAAAATVSVTDAGTGRAVVPPRPPKSEQEHGRGLLITRALATGWGQRRTGDGLTVWAELATPSPGPAR